MQSLKRLKLQTYLKPAKGCEQKCRLKYTSVYFHVSSVYMLIQSHVLCLELLLIKEY